MLIINMNMHNSMRVNPNFNCMLILRMLFPCFCICSLRMFLFCIAYRPGPKRAPPSCLKFYLIIYSFNLSPCGRGRRVLCGGVRGCEACISKQGPIFIPENRVLYQNRSNLNLSPLSLYKTQSKTWFFFELKNP